MKITLIPALIFVIVHLIFPSASQLPPSRFTNLQSYRLSHLRLDEHICAYPREPASACADSRTSFTHNKGNQLSRAAFRSVYIAGHPGNTCKLDITFDFTFRITLTSEAYIVMILYDVVGFGITHRFLFASMTFSLEYLHHYPNSPNSTSRPRLTLLPALRLTSAPRYPSC